MKQKHLNTLFILWGIIGFSILIFGQQAPEEKPENLLEVHALNLPSSIDFANETVPIHQPEVQERLDRELLVNVYWQSNGILLIKRSHKYFPVIEPILKENNIPDDFKYLVVIESGLQNVVSPSGAAGFWQFMKNTAIEYDLEVNSNIDERYNLEKATRAACEYLKNAYEKTGSWTLAAAAYNAGLNRIERHMELQQTKNYYDLLLNAETSRYVFRILAVKEILKNPKKYGFYIQPSQYYHLEKTTTIPINYTIESLVDFAKQHHTNYKTLKLLNPWLRASSLKNKHRKTYFIKIPKT